MAEQSQWTGAAGGAAQGAATGAQVGGVYGAVIGGVIGGVAGFLGGGGEKAAKKAAKAQAAEILRAARENRRVQTRQANLQVSTAKVRTYASNLVDRGSTRKYRTELEREYRRGIDYDFQAAQRAADAVRQSGSAAAGQIKRAGLGQMIGGFASAGTAAAGAGWFDSPQSSSGLGYVQAGSGGAYTTSAPAPSLLQKK